MSASPANCFRRSRTTLDLPRVVALVELDLDALIELGAHQCGSDATRHLAEAATQDLSLVVPLETPAGEVLAAVVAGAGELLEDARLVDDYRGTGLPNGRKSLTFALRFRAPDRTLTAAEASEAKLARRGARGRAVRGYRCSRAAVTVPASGLLPATRPPSRPPIMLLGVRVGKQAAQHPAEVAAARPGPSSAAGAAAFGERNCVAMNDSTIGATIGSTCLMMSMVTFGFGSASASFAATLSVFAPNTF